ncbi:Protein MRPL-12 [Aphelenchoides avenae]|nr:Protein MRPL-12 [Aphelenchus avenae]
MLVGRTCSRTIAAFARTAISRTYASAAAAVAESSPQGVPAAAGPSTEAAPTPDEPRVVSAKVQELVSQITSLSLLEVSDLNYALKKKLNIPDTPMMAAGMMMAAPAAAAAGGGQEQAADDTPQKLSFALKLTKFDDAKKIALIKEIRTLMPNLNLVQAKKFVETAPVEVKGDMSKNEAEELKAALEKVGATCEIV